MTKYISERHYLASRLVPWASDKARERINALTPEQCDQMVAENDAWARQWLGFGPEDDPQD